MTRNKRGIVRVLRDMIINDVKKLTPEQLQIHLQTGRLNARGTHQSKKVYRRKGKYGQVDR